MPITGKDMVSAGFLCAMFSMLGLLLLTASAWTADAPLVQAQLPPPDGPRAVQELRHRREARETMTREELLLALQALAARDPVTREDLVQLEAESFLLAEQIRQSAVCNETPEIVWHFLSDADIRFKDEEYKRSQCQRLVDGIRQ